MLKNMEASYKAAGLSTEYEEILFMASEMLPLGLDTVMELAVKSAAEANKLVDGVEGSDEKLQSSGFEITDD
jgi:hypothetical protein